MKIAPIRTQYLKIKNRYPGIIVFFRIGDFYETFDDDARITSKELEITLTSKEMGKGNRVPLAGIPYHAVDNYLYKLINRGYKIAICEQLGVPGKGLVERDVVRIVTPGTIMEPHLLNEYSNNYLASIAVNKDDFGLAYVDISTGEFCATQLHKSQLHDELERIKPTELLISENTENLELDTTASITKLDNYWFDVEAARQVLLDHFNVITLEGFGLENQNMAVKASGAIIHYISETQKIALGLIKQISVYSVQNFMTIDHQTRRNLELFISTRWENTSNTLLSVVDMTKTAMGRRLIKQWLGQPLLDMETIDIRQKYITYFYINNIVRHKLINRFAGVADIERIINRVKSISALPRDLIALKDSLIRISEINLLISGNNELESMHFNHDSLTEIINLISNGIVNNPQLKVDQGGVIKAGYSDDLDKMRNISAESKRTISQLEQNEKLRTGIKSLKVRYNNIFGYFIEVSKANLNLIPDNYIRKQTLINCERFYTPELKEYEVAILDANDKIREIETSIYRDICAQIAIYSDKILEVARVLAELDVFTALAEVAVKYKYVRPNVNNSSAIKIRAGRHPVIERVISHEEFIPNDTSLDNNDTQIVILTGPNMSGKSTYLKQVALNVLLAQIGSYIAAESADIGIVNRIFTRIGAQEDLAAGQSTFMIEMTETANILHNATSRSLIILDEVGRGTSTYDGISIAWAIVEYLHNKPNIHPKTLFATHYHELAQLANTLPRVKNYNVLVNEENGRVTFLRKIVPGVSDRSYGIHVAQIAGMPLSVLRRANNILSLMDCKDPLQNLHTKNVEEKEERQISLFQNPAILIQDLMSIDLDAITPMEAMTIIYNLKEKLRKLSG